MWFVCAPHKQYLPRIRRFDWILLLLLLLEVFPAGLFNTYLQVILLTDKLMFIKIITKGIYKKFKCSAIK